MITLPVTPTGAAFSLSIKVSSLPLVDIEKTPFFHKM
jgi:hypothetical protein